MTHRIAASKSTRCSKTQEATGAETSKALLSVLSSGRLASFGGSSLVALMVKQSVPKSLPASKLAYEENLAELEKEAAKNSFKRQSLMYSLCFNILCVASFCLTLLSHSFQLQSLQQKELASLHQLELPHLGTAVKSFQLTRAQLYSTEKTALESFQLTTAQLCRSISSNFQAADPRTVVRKAAFQETGTTFQTGAFRSIPFRSAAFKTLVSAISSLNLHSVCLTSFQGEFQQLLQDPASAITTINAEKLPYPSRRTTNFSRKRVDELEETNKFAAMGQELAKYIAHLRPLGKSVKSFRRKIFASLRSSRTTFHKNLTLMLVK